VDARGPQESGIHQALEILARRRWLGIVIFLGVLVPGLSVIASLPDIYRASATVLVERQQVPETFVRPAVTDELEIRLHAISEEVMSRSKLQELIERFDLYPRQRATLSSEALVERMRRDIGLDLKGVERTWDRGATVAFALGYRGREPHRVAEVANAVASLYVEQNLKAREQQATRTADFLKTQLDEMKRKLEEQEDRIGQYKKRHPGELPQQVESNISVLERLNGQLQINGDKQARAMERRDRLAGQAAGVAPGAVAGAPEDVEARIERLSLELAELRRQYTDSYPDVVRLQREIAGLRRQVAETPPDSSPRSAAPSEDAAKPPVAAGPGARADAEIVSLKHEENRLRRSIAEYERRIDAAPQRQQEFQALSRDYETTKELYDSLLKHYQESLVSESMEHGQATEQFRILDPALPPRQAEAPNRLWLSLMGLMFSLGAAVMGMVLAERLDTSFHDVDSIRAFTRLPILARIPRIVTRADTVWKVVKMSLAIVLLAAGLAAAGAASYHLAHDQEQLVLILGGGRL
jgi:polysaccharide chain length determinant protein (PEP-CTERM system associated)